MSITLVLVAACGGSGNDQTETPVNEAELQTMLLSPIDIGWVGLAEGVTETVDREPPTPCPDTIFIPRPVLAVQRSFTLSPGNGADTLVHWVGFYPEDRTYTLDIGEEVDRDGVLDAFKSYIESCPSLDDGPETVGGWNFNVRPGALTYEFRDGILSILTYDGAGRIGPEDLLSASSDALAAKLEARS